MKKILILVNFIFIASYVFSVENPYFLDFKSSDFTVSSYLKEGTTEYSAECLSSGDELPWVPETAENAFVIINNCDAKDIVISSGFVKKSRKDLYEKNSRPKTVRIDYLKTNKQKVIVLKDTSEPQIINIFSSDSETEPIRLLFIENYNGSKYKDLCINFICKAIKKRNPCDSIDIQNLSFSKYKGDSVKAFIESFYDKNLQVEFSGDVFQIYNNADFPEVRFNKALIDFDITISYVEVVKIIKKSGTQYELTFSCDNESESFIFDSAAFKVEKIKSEKYQLKE